MVRNKILIIVILCHVQNSKLVNYEYIFKTIKVLQNYKFVFVLKLYQVQHIFYYFINIIVVSSNYAFNEKCYKNKFTILIVKYM